MSTYRMTSSEKAKFLSSDEGRGEVRQEAAAYYSGSETIQIVDENDDLFDTISGSEYVPGESDEMAVVLTDEEVAERHESSKLEAVELARIEEVVKPQVFAKLKEDAKTEVREEFQTIVHDQAEQIRQLTAEKVRLMSDLTANNNKHLELIAEYETLKGAIK